MELHAKESRESSRRMPGRWFGVLVILSVLMACATPGDLHTFDPSRRKPQPVITRGGDISSESAAADILARASGETSHADRAQLQKLTDAVRRSLTAPLMAGNRVTALVDGPETFAAIDAAIANAHRSIHLETYIFAAD